MTTPLPSRNECSAPKFDPKDEQQLPTFFDEYEKVATAAGLDENDVEKKKGALRYTDAETTRFWRSLHTYVDSTKTWAQFKTEVLENYPEALLPTVSTIEDLKKVIEGNRKQGISNTLDLAKYHRSFQSVSASLELNGILSAVQIASYYVSPFPDSIRSRLDTRLQVKYPSKMKGQAYTLSELKTAIDFLLSDASTPLGNFNLGDRVSIPVTSTSANVPAKVESADNTDSLRREMSSLVLLVNKLVSSQSQNLEGPANSPKSKRERTCGFCGKKACEAKSVRDCEEMKDWLEKGYLEKDSNGFARMRGGISLPDEDRYKRGPLKARFELYWRENPTAKTWMLEPVSCSLSEDYAGIQCSRHTAYTLNGYQGPDMLAAAANAAPMVDKSERSAVKALVLQMENHRSKREQAVANPKTSGAAPSPASLPPVSDTDPAPPAPSVPIPTRPITPIKPVKPIIGKLPTNYYDSRNFRYRAPIESEAAVKRVIDAGFNTTVSVRHEDLLAIAPDYRRRMKECVTGKRIGVDGNLVENSEDSLMLQTMPDSGNTFDVYFNHFRNAEEGDGFYVAKSAHPIRAINAIIGDRPVHCITDGGCSIVGMSDAVCNALGITFDPTNKIEIQSANRGVNLTLGLAKDVPFRFGDITVFLQVHIIPSPAYDVLLGRPFEILTQAVFHNFLSGEQHLTITDPNNNRVVTIPTLKREPPRFHNGEGRDVRN
ncbi:hypothetical protein GGU10DRAFT_380509 [Lentinula aff. detonsa]|uniref:Uncharacterized protein n=1 Tax=Lentinula aff. detonsa TaxID=2804958 RepID=A0AA38KDB6_9AGAR|nr:hypothetical protein GGU10DRAFT_380509 [Lentinula aff. detonsa]